MGVRILKLISFNKSLGSEVIKRAVPPHVQKCTVLLRKLVGDFLTIINFSEYGKKEQASLATHKKKQRDKGIHNIVKFKCIISAQCVGYWTQMHRNKHAVALRWCHCDNRSKPEEGVRSC